MDGRVITAADYRTDPEARDVADRVLRALGYDPRQVRRMVIGQRSIRVDAMDRRTGLVRTHHWTNSDHQRLQRGVQ